MIDHWLLPLPVLGRWLFWIIGVGGTAGWMVWYLFPVILQRINPVYAARRIEQSNPQFKDGLVSWLELEQLPDNGVPRGIMAGLARHAAKYLHDQDPSSTVDSSALIRVAGILLLIFASLSVYTMASPKSVVASGQRILMPWLSLEAPTRVRILEVKPGACELTQGLPLKLNVTLRGLRRGEPVSARFSTVDGQLRDQKRTLQSVTEGYSYAGSLSTDSTGVEHELDYWIEAGDAVAGPFRVTISPLPTLEVEHVRLEFPSYTKLPTRVVTGGQVEAVEGSKATIFARANQPIVRARLEIDPQVDAQDELIRAGALLDMKVDKSHVSVTLPLRLNDARDNPTELKYRIRGFNAQSLANQRPILQSLKVLADLPPEVSLLGPENRVLKVMSKSQVNLEIRASDPDFGLNTIELSVTQEKTSVRREVLLETDGVLGRQVATFRLNMSEIKAKVGERFEFLATARDNRHDPDTGAWSPNISNSTPLTIEVVEPERLAAEPPQNFVEEPSPDNRAAPNDNSQVPSRENDSNNSNKSQQPSAHRNGSKSDSTDSAKSSETGEPKTGNQQGAEGASSEQQKSGSGASGSAGGSSSKQKSSDQNSSSQPNGASGKQAGSTGGEQKSSNGSTGGGSNSSNGQREGKSASNSATGQSASQSSKNGSSASKSGSQSKEGAGQTSAQEQDGSASGKPGSDGEVIERVGEYVREKQDSPRTPNGQPSTKSGGEQSPENSPSDSSPPNPSASQQAHGQSKSGTGQSKTGQPRPKQATGDKTETSQPGADQSGAERSESGQARGSQSKNDKSKAGESGEGPSAKSKSDGSQSRSDSSKSVESGESPSAKSKTDGGKSGSGQSQGKQSGDDQSGSQQPSGTQSASSQPKAGQSNAGQSSGNQSKGEKSSAAGQSGGDKSQGSPSQGSPSQGSPSQGIPSQGSPSQGSSSQGSKSGGEQSAGKQSSGEQSGNEKSSGGQASGGQSKGGQSSGGQPKSGQQGGESSSAQSGSGQSGGGKAGASSGTGQTAGTASAASADSGGGKAGGGPGEDSPANEDYARRATEMVLDYLEHQKDQPDPELLKRLEWTPQDLNSFLDRWRKARQFADSPDPNQQRQWEDMLNNLDLQPPTANPRGATSSDDKLRGMQDSGTRVRPPENLRKKFEAIRKAMQQRKGSS